MSENSRKVIVKLTGKNQKGQLKNKISFSQHGMQFFIIFWNTCNHEMLLFKRNLFQCTVSLSRILSTKPVTNIWEIFWKIQTSPMGLQTSPIYFQTSPICLQTPPYLSMSIDGVYTHLVKLLQLLRFLYVFSQCCSFLSQLREEGISHRILVPPALHDWK